MKGRFSQAATLVALRRRLRRPAEPVAALHALRRHALEQSRYYQRTQPGSLDRPLSELPILTKDDLVDHFDEIVVDPRITLGGIHAFLREAEGGERFLGRYRIGVSSGSSGRPGVLAFDRQEWVALLANAARARALADAAHDGGQGHPSGRRSAKISSPSPWHLSAQVGATLADPRRPVLRLPATTPMPDLVRELDRWQPASLSAYASVLGQLADEQRAGRLHVRPSAVYSGAEVLTAAGRAGVRDAWGVETHDQYVTTEAGFIATECRAHHGMHVLDDHVLLEIVDDELRPVEQGAAGTRALLTVLHSRTVPLIRFELTDVLRELPGTCPCGHSSRRIEVLGRTRELVTLPGPRGLVQVHPVVFTQVMDRERVTGWRVRIHRDATITVQVAGLEDPSRADELATRLGTEIERVVGAAPVIAVELVDVIPRGPGGKRSLVVVDGAD